MSEDLYWRLHSLSKILECSGLIDESQHPDAYSTILDAMSFVRRHPAENLYDAQVQAGAVPLTDEQMYEARRRAASQLFDLAQQWADNKIHSYQFANEAEKIVNAVARRVEAAHGIGIKGGQHGTE